jgi:putative cell wall-binding protein
MFILTCTLALSLPAAAHAATLEGFAGDSRYTTAIAVSKAAFPAGAGAVVLATGQNWPDALSGTGLAGAVDGPVLLTESWRLTPGVLAEIERLGASEIYVLGSATAVSDNVLASLVAALPQGTTITRLGGENRYDTAALVASATIAARPGWDGTVFLATGQGFADAEAAGPVAVALGRPVFLIDEIPAARRVPSAMSASGVTRAVILGGEPTISAALEAQVAATAGATERLAGPDRFATALAVATYAETNAGFTWARPGIATSDDFADGLTGGVLLGKRKAPLLPTPRAGLPDRIASALYSHRATVATFTVFGGTSAVPAHVRQEAQHALVALYFDINRAMSHVSAITAFGPRTAGGTAERKALEYVAAQLEGWGYTVRTQTVMLPDGKTSHNVIAERAGTSTDVLLLGGHIDSKYPSPGGNDNASGVATVLELARVLANTTSRPTVRFMAFAAEEISGDTADDHHFGSRQYVASLSSTERARIHGMVSVDMVGYGSTFNVRSLGTGPQEAVTSLKRRAWYIGQALPYLRDPGRYGWSDHEGFERVGIPAAWLEWREDPVYHTTRDTASHVQPSRVRVTGRLLRGWVLGMDDAGLEDLR